MCFRTDAFTAVSEWSFCVYSFSMLELLVLRSEGCFSLWSVVFLLFFFIWRGDAHVVVILHIRFSTWNSDALSVRWCCSSPSMPGYASRAP